MRGNTATFRHQWCNTRGELSLLVTTTRSELLIALNACTVLSRDEICTLAKHLESWQTSAEASTTLSDSLGVHRESLEKALAVRDAAATTAKREARQCDEAGIRLLTWHDDAYPIKLLDLELPPPVLYCRGRIPRRPAIAIVGSRRADAYGIAVAETFAADLAAKGMTVVSGLALGVDSSAHRSALDQEHGTSVAVLGCGIDVHYPHGSGRLQERLAAHGAVVSEFPLGTAPLARNFPIRNRIIAALAASCLVIQATHRSGSLITARLALNLGRDVYAIPGRIFDRYSKGTNSLIRDGAFLVTHPRDILDTLPLEAKESLAEQASSQANEEPPEGDSRQLLRIFELGESHSADRLAATLEAPIEKVLEMLMDLELGGWIRRAPGALYRLRSTSMG